MTTILFEDEGYAALLPLVYSRPTYDLRCGIFTLRERVAAQTGAQPSAICRPHLAVVYGSGRWPLHLLSRSEPVVLVNGRALETAWLPELLDAPLNTLLLADAGVSLLGTPVLLGAKLSPHLASAVLGYLLAQRGAAALAELMRFCAAREVKTKLLSFPWDLVNENGAQIASDCAIHQRANGWPSAAARPPEAQGIVISAPERVFIHPDAWLHGPLAIDARGGPIVIDAATIEPFSFIQGPCFIGEGALISSAKVRGETSIGPWSRIGGEVEASIVQAYSNKHHEGFLGHAYLGEWVNIGAMTTNSDLKNTYGNIRMTIEGLGQVDSGTLKLGCFLADHVKLGIGVHLNGGAMIGTGANIFGVHFAPKTIPPFTWGGQVFREYRIDSMIDVTRKVMGRRKIPLTADGEALLRDVFAQTRGDRTEMRGTTSLRAAPADEAALAAAEAAVLE